MINLDYKKIYYYAICIMTFFVMLWGAIDLTSASIGLTMTRSAPAVSEAPMEKEGEPFVDAYYQRKMLYDRLFDSLSRVIIGGLIFTYSRIKINQLEG